MQNLRHLLNEALEGCHRPESLLESWQVAAVGEALVDRMPQLEVKKRLVNCLPNVNEGARGSK
jgi:hypothetical protein